VSARRLLISCSLASAALALGVPPVAWSAKELKFSTVPALPALSAVTLNAQSQTVNTTMTNFAVSDTRGTKSGWNVTVEGQSGSGMSAVFAQYCPKAKCGSTAEGYVGGGATLAADSLTLNSTAAKISGGTGSTPTLQCSSSCNVDSASAVKIVSASTSEKTWTTSGWSKTSLALAVPTTVKALPSEEVYRVNILWTLSSGP
jgi:WxL domain surface cell wall-binding